MDGLRRLEEEIRKCTRCPLHTTRTHAVPGEGGFRKRVMLIGEAPGKNEDEQGRPFVGRAGQLLDSLLREAGLTRADVYITNVVKCRPPGNRDPKDEEIEACTPFLRRQLSLLYPRVIVTLVRFAWVWVCSETGLPCKKLSEARGKVYTLHSLEGKVHVFPTYHPAAAIYNRSLLDTLREDFRTLKDLLRTLGLL